MTGILPAGGGTGITSSKLSIFNEDKPYKQFITEQLAGDEVDKPSFDSVIATAFYRVGPRVRFREKQNPSNRFDYVDDVVRTTFQGFMGLSVNCARCHDHKFDPITQMDYFRSVGMFWGYVDYDRTLAPRTEVEARHKIRLDVEKQTAPLRSQVSAIEKSYRDKQNQTEIDEALKKFPEDIQAAYRTPEARRTPGQRPLRWTSRLPV